MLFYCKFFSRKTSLVLRPGCEIASGQNNLEISYIYGHAEFEYDILKDKEHGSSVGRARDFSSGGQEFDRAPASYGLGRCQYNVPAETEVIVSPICFCMPARKIVRRQSWGPSARYTVDGEDVKKQPSQLKYILICHNTSLKMFAYLKCVSLLIC